jgi:hypothetical protein
MGQSPPTVPKDAGKPQHRKKDGNDPSIEDVILEETLLEDAIVSQFL